MLYVTQDYKEAMARYRQALDKDSGIAEAMVSLELAYLKGERYARLARALLGSPTGVEPQSSTAHLYLGYCHLRLGDLDKASESFRTVISMDRRDWEAYRALGAAYILTAVSEDNASLRAQAVDQWRLSLQAAPRQPQSARLLKLIQRFSY